jgi:hypothetical protein
MIYMVHPQHGAMHVYDEAQAVANEKNGWVRADEPSVKTTEVKQEVLGAVEEDAPRKFFKK